MYSNYEVFIHPLDAKARDLRRGDKVKVVSRRGEVISIVENARS